MGFILGQSLISRKEKADSQSEAGSKIIQNDASSYAELISGGWGLISGRNVHFGLTYLGGRQAGLTCLWQAGLPVVPLAGRFQNEPSR